MQRRTDSLLIDKFVEKGWEGEGWNRGLDFVEGGGCSANHEIKFHF